ncbi:Conidiation-specific protein 6 [Phaffia rhodozyma]|uniref:Conidiation-specific protein 6 n=1 Tax=Phaffia rhodozyma TaxID=264483 RepID=A0A0F7SWF2_PHARH|nr:Conidiation-specific protein 6 [Phaffia rhodozyma]
MSPVSPKSPQKSNHVKDPVRVAAGYKATLHNSKASDLAHEHAQQMLNQIEHKNDLTEVSAQGQKEHLVHVLAGHKATLASSRTSEEAKARSRQVLKDAGETV